MNVRLFDGPDSLLAACRDILDRIASTTLVPSVAASEELRQRIVDHGSRAAIALDDSVIQRSDATKDPPRMDPAVLAEYAHLSSLPSTPGMLPDQNAESPGFGTFDAIFVDVTEVDDLDANLARAIPRARSLYLVASGAGARPIVDSFREGDLDLPIGDEMWWLVDSEAWLREN